MTLFFVTSVGTAFLLASTLSTTLHCFSNTIQYNIILLQSCHDAACTQR